MELPPPTDQYPLAADNGGQQYVNEMTAAHWNRFPIGRQIAHQQGILYQLIPPEDQRQTQTSLYTIDPIIMQQSVAAGWQATVCSGKRLPDTNLQALNNAPANNNPPPMPAVPYVFVPAPLPAFANPPNPGNMDPDGDDSSESESEDNDENNNDTGDGERESSTMNSRRSSREDDSDGQQVDNDGDSEMGDAMPEHITDNEQSEYDSSAEGYFRDDTGYQSGRDETVTNQSGEDARSTSDTNARRRQASESVDKQAAVYGNASSGDASRKTSVQSSLRSLSVNTSGYNADNDSYSEARSNADSDDSSNTVVPHSPPVADEEEDSDSQGTPTRASSISSDHSDPVTACCGRGVGYDYMAECNNCQQWFHLNCVSMPYFLSSEEIRDNLAKWYCPDCQDMGYENVRLDEQDPEELGETDTTWHSR